jgi:YesN/AraC family two-component response regulator
MTLVPNPSSQDSIKEVLHYCLEHYTEPLTLDSISEALHLNKYYISHMFKERMHLSFSNFLNGMRTEHACTLLEKGESITEAAFSSGFSSIRNFNRIFAQNMGLTPSEYSKLRK